MNVAATPGSITGITTRASATSREAPSTCAASSSATGTFSKKPRMMIVLNGTSMATYTSMSPASRLSRSRSDMSR